MRTVVLTRSTSCDITAVTTILAVSNTTAERRLALGLNVVLLDQVLFLDAFLLLPHGWSGDPRPN